MTSGDIGGGGIIPPQSLSLRATERNLSSEGARLQIFATRRKVFPSTLNTGGFFTFFSTNKLKICPANLLIVPSLNQLYRPLPTVRHLENSCPPLVFPFSPSPRPFALPPSSFRPPPGLRGSLCSIALYDL